MSETFENLSNLTNLKSLRQSRKLLNQKREIKETSRLIRGIIKKDQGKENLIIFIRRHWVNFFFQLFPFFALILLLFFVYFLAIYFGSFDFFSDLEWKIVHLILAFLGLFFWSFIFIVFLDYYLDVWIITNSRIINIEQKGLFRREISELRIENMQDVTTEIGGIIPTFFDYGDLYIQTAGKRERFLFKSIAHPERIRDIILVLSEEQKIA